MNALYFVKFDHHDKVRMFDYKVVLLVTVESGVDDDEKQRAEIKGRCALTEPGIWKLSEVTRVCSTPDTLECPFEPC